MERFRTFICKFFISLAVGCMLVCNTVQPAKAQFGVLDATSIISNLGNTIKQVSVLLEELGVNTENLGIMKDMMDYAGDLIQLSNDLGQLNAMYSVLTSQLKVYEMYLKRVYNLQLQGFNVATVTEIVRRYHSSVDLIENMIKQAMKIATDIGLTKDKKYDEAQKAVDKIILESDKETKFLFETVDYLESMKGLLEVDNLLSGRDPNADFTDIGSTDIGSAEQLSTVMQSVTASDLSAYGEEAPEVRLVGKMGMRAIVLIVGLLLTIGLVGVTMRFMRGTPGGEEGFMRIFIIIVAAIVFFVVMNKVFHL